MEVAAEPSMRIVYSWKMETIRVNGFRSILTMHARQVTDMHNGKFHQQSGAICYRDAPDGDRQILLISSRDSGRWVIPKGNIDKRESARKAAAREAMEEAGLKGKMSKKPIGFYTYLKSEMAPPCLVEVFVLEVTASAKKFLEKDIRTLVWVPVDEAVRRVEEPELKGLIARVARNDHVALSPH